MRRAQRISPRPLLAPYLEERCWKIDPGIHRPSPYGTLLSSCEVSGSFLHVEMLNEHKKDPVAVHTALEKADLRRSSYMEKNKGFILSK